MQQVATTTVYLSEIEARQFLDFQKHYDLIGLLNSINAFDLKSGYVTIHFDKVGNIKGVDKHEVFSV